MKTYHFGTKTALAMAMSIAMVWQANATIAYQNQAGNYGNQSLESPQVVIGMQFTVGANALNVTSLGAFDNGQNGWGSSVITVGIYDFNSHALLGTSASFFGAGANLGTLGADGGSRFQSVTPFTLSAGGMYMIVAAGYGGAGGEQNYNSLGNPNPYSSVDSAITAGNNWYISGSTLTFPNVLDGGPSPRYGGGTFEFSPVPETSTFAVASVALLGFVYLGRFSLRKVLPS